MLILNILVLIVFNALSLATKKSEKSDCIPLIAWFARLTDESVYSYIFYKNDYNSVNVSITLLTDVYASPEISLFNRLLK